MESKGRNKRKGNGHDKFKLRNGMLKSRNPRNVQQYYKSKKESEYQNCGKLRCYQNESKAAKKDTVNKIDTKRIR